MMVARPTLGAQREAARRHAARLDDMLGRLARLERTSQLANSSIEDGAVRAFDEAGLQTMTVGRQFDDTNVASSLTGPVPPTPTGASVIGFPGGLSVAWDGLFVDDDTGFIDVSLIAPMDFKQVDVVVATDDDADFIAIQPTQSFLSPRGGRVFLSFADTTPRYVALVTRTLAGKPSSVSARGVGTPLANNSNAQSSAAYDIAVSALQAANGTIRTYTQATAPWADGTTRPAEDFAALWVDTDDPALPTYRWINSAWTLLPDTAYGALSARIDALEALLDDTGWVNLTPMTGFKVSGTLRYRRIGQSVQIDVYGVTNNAAIDVGAAGGLADTPFCRLPASIIPTVNKRAPGMWSRGAWFHVSSDTSGVPGSIYVVAADGNGTPWTIPANTVGSATINYMLG